MDLEELARVQRVNPATDLEQQTAAAIQIAAIKPDGRLEGMKARRVRGRITHQRRAPEVALKPARTRQ